MRASIKSHVVSVDEREPRALEAVDRFFIKHTSNKGLEKPKGFLDGFRSYLAKEGAGAY